MKRTLIVCLAILGILILPIFYSSAKGYTSWFWRNFHAVVLVDGQPVRGYIHQSKSTLIITRRDTSNPHSYMITNKDSEAYILDCGNWAAPSFFVFGINHVNPPCVREILDASISAPDSPHNPTIVQNGALEFHTKNGRTIKVTY
jgi:hypothetical protein